MAISGTDVRLKSRTLDQFLCIYARSAAIAPDAQPPQTNKKQWYHGNVENLQIDGYHCELPSSYPHHITV